MILIGNKPPEHQADVAVHCSVLTTENGTETSHRENGRYALVTFWSTQAKAFNWPNLLGVTLGLLTFSMMHRLWWSLSWIDLLGMVHICTSPVSSTTTNADFFANTLAKDLNAFGRVMSLSFLTPLPSFESFLSHDTAPQLTELGILSFCCQLQ